MPKLGVFSLYHTVLDTPNHLRKPSAELKGLKANITRYEIDLTGGCHNYLVKILREWKQT